MKSEEVQSIVEKNHATHGGLIAILEKVQAKYGYLPEDALRKVAEETNRSLVDVFGVATFYKAFSLKPRGRHLVSCCLGTACHVQGGPRIVEEFERQLGVKAGETTKDREFTLGWERAVRIDWGTILLFGGGLSLGGLMFSTGLAEYMGKAVTGFTGADSLWAITAIGTALAIVLSETTSNTASANMVIPVVIEAT